MSSFQFLRWLMTCLCLCMSAAGRAAPAQICGDEFTPCEQPRPSLRLRSLQIDQASAHGVSWTEADDCSRFRITLAQAHHYLSRAGTITENARHHIVIDSPCIATGRLTLKNGLTARWTIGEAREGELRWNDGRVELLYCSRCTTPPFAPQ